MPSRHLRLLVFISGMSVMAVELTGLRLLAPFFGTSMIVTTILIGSLMAFLSLGYWLGGRHGDRRPDLHSLCRVTSAAAVLVLLLPFMGQPILRGAAMAIRPALNTGHLSEPRIAIAMVIGSLVGILLLFAGPVTLMGMVSPWAVRLAVSDVKDSGTAAGRLYALSTFGSIIGSFLPALLLVPLLGVRNTFVCVGVTLLAVSAPGALGRPRGGAATLVAALLFLIPQGWVMPVDGLVYEDESLYHHIQVVDGEYGNCPHANLLLLNEGVGIHSASCRDPEIAIRGAWAYTSAASLFRDDPMTTKEVCVIGLAGGTNARKMLDVHPQAHIDGIEIDGRIVEVGREYFDNEDPRVTPYVLDGRIFLQATDRKYDVLLMDAYRPPYIPFHLTTVEWWRVVRDHMTEDAVACINVAGAPSDDQTLLRRIYRTMREVFPSVHYLKATRSNDILYATTREKPIGIAQENLQGIPTGTELDAIRKVWKRKVKGEVKGWQDALVLTDDQAPVEMLWDVAAFGYARGDLI